MNIRSAFPSKYLKASDIPDGQFVQVKIDKVEIENVAGTDNPDDEKPVIYFIGKHKGMVLNRTNSDSIATAYGDESDAWHGKTVSLYATETSFQGKNVPCLRIKIAKQAPAARAAATNGGAVSGADVSRSRVTQPAAASPISEEQEIDPDSIPF